MIAKRPAAGQSSPPLDLSIVVPVLDEQDNVVLSTRRSSVALEEFGRIYEIIVVDDGSRRRHVSRGLCASRRGRPALKLVRSAGTSARRRRWRPASITPAATSIVPIDGDLQNDPGDIAPLLEKIDEGYDVVSGWRRDRKDSFVAPAALADRQLADRPRHRCPAARLRLHAQGVPRRDRRARRASTARCTASSRRSHQAGARITEIPVRHHPRTSGRSKYGLGRTFKVLLDLMTVKFLSVWSTKPSYVFGGSGAILCFLGSLFVVWTAYETPRQRHLRVPPAVAPRRCLPVHDRVQPDPAGTARRARSSARTTSRRRSRSTSSASAELRGAGAAP